MKLVNVPKITYREQPPGILLDRVRRYAERIADWGQGFNGFLAACEMEDGSISDNRTVALKIEEWLLKKDQIDDEFGCWGIYGDLVAEPGRIIRVDIQAPEASPIEGKRGRSIGTMHGTFRVR